MNILLWVLQVALALHTIMGAIWKFSQSEQSVPSLSALPHAVWLSLSVVEILCAVRLVIGLFMPIFQRTFAIVAPLSAAIIAAEMLLFVGVHLASGRTEHGQMIYWIVVAVICSFIAVGRFMYKPN